MNSTKNFYVFHNNQQSGPMSWKTLVKNNYPMDALIWSDGMADWKSLCSFISNLPPEYVASDQSYTSAKNTIYAGFAPRLGAYLIDFLILLPIGILGFFIHIPLFISILISWLYFALFESGSYQATPGKMALNLKVANYNYGQISFLQATGRHFGKIISGLILFIGYLMILWTERKQGLHDQMAETYVLKNR